MNIVAEIISEDSRWENHKIYSEDLIKEILSKIFNRYSFLKELNLIELSILLTNDTKIKNLNKNFRNKEKSTNVLSFPSYEIPHINNTPKFLEINNDNISEIYLGDIAFSLETIISEAKQQQKDISNHFYHLLTHSVLHLLGYDHQNDQEASHMEKLETEILSSFSIKDPYQLNTSLHE